MKLFKSFKIIATAIGALFSILLFVGYFLLVTGTGSRWLIQTLDSSNTQLSIAEIKGTIASQLQLEQLVYKDGNEFSVSVKQLKFNWNAIELLQGRIHISLFQLDGIDVKGTPPAGEEATSDSEIPLIPITIEIDQLAINQLQWLTADSHFNLQQFLLTARLENNTLTLSKLALVTTELKVTANSEIKLQSDWPLTANLGWQYSKEKTAVSGVLAVSGNTEKFDLISELKGDVESSQKGYVKLTGDNPEFNLHGDWKKIQWPLSVEPQISSPRGVFELAGTTAQYQATLNADVMATGQPNILVDLKGKGGLGQFDFEHLNIKPAQGQLNLSGLVSWTDSIEYSLQVVANQLNLLEFGSDIPGEINLIAQSKGHIEGDNYQAELDIESLKGEIYEQPLNATGEIKLNQQQLDIQQLKIMAGSNTLQVNGALSKTKSDLELKIAAADLRTAWPNLEGNLNGSALIKGSLNKPIIKGQFIGQNLRYLDKQIDGLNLDADYAHNSQRQSRFKLLLNNIQWTDIQIEQLALNGQGNLNHHSAQLDLQSSLADLNMDTQGKWNGKQWLGGISQLDIDHPQLEQWQLASQAELMFQPNKDSFFMTLDNSCLTQEDAQLCLSAKGSPDKKLDAQLQLSALPLSIVKPWLPKELSLNGLLSAQAKIVSSKKQLTAKVDMNATEAQVQLKDLEEQIQYQLAVSPASLQMQYELDQLVSNLQLGFGDQDIINVKLNADKANQSGVRLLNGKVNASIVDMTLINRLIPQVSKLKGLFVADLDISGNTEQPAVTGFAEWKDAEFDVHQLGTTFKNINLNIHSTTDDQHKLLLDLALESGEGHLKGQGYIKLKADENYPLYFAMQGEQFSISRLPEAEVDVSPQLTIESENGLTSVKGLIKIDSAKVEIKELPESAVSISKDEVIIMSDPSKQENLKQGQLPANQIQTQVVIDFGEHSYFTGFGLETRLTGQLEYLTNKDKQQMQGRAVMKDATYKSYGQDLTIRKGEFLFNGPTDNPWLNIEAIRKAKSENITAILSVTGPLKSPQTKISSEPALPEAEALAYLVTGHSAENMGKGEGNAVATAALGYGVGQLSWFSDQLGIDELEFVESDKIEESAVRLGHYLNPDLYVGVTTGLFASTYAVDLRYRLSEHFSVKTSAGETQKIELKYHLETD